MCSRSMVPKQFPEFNHCRGRGGAKQRLTRRVGKSFGSKRNGICFWIMWATGGRRRWPAWPATKKLISTCIYTKSAILTCRLGPSGSAATDWQCFAENRRSTFWALIGWQEVPRVLRKIKCIRFDKSYIFSVFIFWKKQLANVWFLRALRLVWEYFWEALGCCFLFGDHFETLLPRTWPHQKLPPPWVEIRRVLSSKRSFRRL